MKTFRHSSPPAGGFTLLEISIVIMVLLALISVGMFSSKKINEWKLAREAGETLRTVYTAQRMYLADNPTTSLSLLTEEKLIPYLPNVPTTCTEKTFKGLQTLKLFPVNTSLTGATLSFLVNESPPRVAISGLAYDPSGSTTDSLWDVGQ